MTRRLRILIVDDHAIVRAGLRQTLADASDIGDIGEAATPPSAMDLVRKRDWDAVVLDLGLPGRGGLELLKDIKRERPKLPVLILSMYPEDQFGLRALRAGASSYLSKESAPEHLVDAVRKVAAGFQHTEIRSGAAGPLHTSLSDREFDVLRLLASAQTVTEIAERLALSVKTVSTYRTRILEKMGMKSNTELMQYAVANHLLD